MDLMEELYRLYSTELIRWCSRMTGDVDRAMDLVQEGFTRAMDNEQVLERLPAEARRAWLYRAIRNLFIDSCRRQSLERSLLCSPAASCDSTEEVSPEEVEGAVDQGYTDAEWDELLLALPAREALVFTLRYLMGYNSKEIGEQLDLPPGTVSFALQRQTAPAGAAEGVALWTQGEEEKVERLKTAL